MKKSISIIFLAFLISGIIASAQENQKKTFGDVFQASVRGGVSFPIANNIYTAASEGLMTHVKSLPATVNPEFDIYMGAKLGEHICLGLGYDNSGAAFRHGGMKAVENTFHVWNEAGTALEDIQNVDEYPTHYGTFDCYYGQFGISFAKWSNFRRVRPILYFRLGVSRNRDYILAEKSLLPDDKTFDREGYKEYKDGFKYWENSNGVYGDAATKYWSIYNAIGLMLSINVYSRLSVIVDIRETQFWLSSNQQVNGYYVVENSPVNVSNLQIKGWLSGNIGLAWNF